MALGLEIAAGVCLLVGTILTIVFTLVARAIRRRLAREYEALAAGGIVRESPVVSGTVRYRDYRRPGYYAGAAIRGVRRRLVLTRAELGVLGSHSTRIPLAELHRYAVSVEDGRLVLRTDDPVGASGHEDLRLALADADEWAHLLRESGARPSDPAG